MEPNYFNIPEQSWFDTKPTGVISSNPKKSRKKLYLIIGLAVAIVAVVGYFTYNYVSQRIADSNKKVPVIVIPKNPQVDAATSTLTGGLGGEATITNTDDSKLATDISGTTTTIGDSINENNF